MSPVTRSKLERRAGSKSMASTGTESSATASRLGKRANGKTPIHTPAPSDHAALPVTTPRAVHSAAATKNSDELVLYENQVSRRSLKNTLATSTPKAAARAPLSSRTKRNASSRPSDKQSAHSARMLTRPTPPNSSSHTAPSRFVNHSLLESSVASACRKK